MHIAQLLTRCITFFSSLNHEIESEKVTVTVTEIFRTKIYAGAFTSYLKPSAALVVADHIKASPSPESEDNTESSGNFGQTAFANLFFPGFIVMPTDMPAVEARSSLKAAVGEEASTTTPSGTVTTSAPPNIDPANKLSKHPIADQGFPTNIGNNHSVPRWAILLALPFKAAARQLPTWKSGSWNTSTSKRQIEYPDLESFPKFNSSSSSIGTFQSFNSSNDTDTSFLNLTPGDISLILDVTGDPAVRLAPQGLSHVVYLDRGAVQTFCEDLSSQFEIAPSTCAETSSSQLATDHMTEAKSTSSDIKKYGVTKTTATSSSTSESGSMSSTYTPDEPTPDISSSRSLSATEGDSGTIFSTPSLEVPVQSHLPSSGISSGRTSISSVRAPKHTGYAGGSDGGDQDAPPPGPSSASSILSSSSTTTSAQLEAITVTQYQAGAVDPSTLASTDWKQVNYTSDAAPRLNALRWLKWLKHLDVLDEISKGRSRHESRPSAAPEHDKRGAVQPGVHPPSSLVRDASSTHAFSHQTLPPTSSPSQAPSLIPIIELSDGHLIISVPSTSADLHTLSPSSHITLHPEPTGIEIIPSFLTIMTTTSLSRVSTDSTPIFSLSSSLVSESDSTSTIQFNPNPSGTQSVTAITGTSNSSLTTKSIFTPGSSSIATTPAASVPNVLPLPTTTSMTAGTGTPGAAVGVGVDLDLVAWVWVVLLLWWA